MGKSEIGHRRTNDSELYQETFPAFNVLLIKKEAMLSNCMSITNVMQNPATITDQQNKGKLCHRKNQ